MPDTFKRYEKKYIISKEQYYELINKLDKYMELDEYCKNNGAYLIRNIYLDTINDDLIRKSCDKPKFKEKIRIRKYGDYNDGADSYFLEMKRKFEGVVYKRRVHLNKNELDVLLNEHTIPFKSNYLESQVLNELKYFIDLYYPVPKTFISYTRIAYKGINDNTFRLTFDYEIKSRRGDYSFDNNIYDKNLLDDNYYLMEVKVGDAMPLWFTKALSDMRIYPTSFSKYGTEFKLQIKGGN